LTFFLRLDAFRTGHELADGIADEDTVEELLLLQDADEDGDIPEAEAETDTEADIEIELGMEEVPVEIVESEPEDTVWEIQFDGSPVGENVDDIPLAESILDSKGTDEDNSTEDILDGVGIAAVEIVESEPEDTVGNSTRRKSS
jgi:hypothetical protein